MTEQLVFGHQNPDTDAVVAALAYAYLQNKLGVAAKAVTLGEANDETKFAFDYFKQSLPEVVSTVADKCYQVMLVDHNEPEQSAADIDKVEVTHVVDHHRIADFNTAAPLYYHAEPVGCCSTIVFKEFALHGIDIPAPLAGLMASAIVSDTLLFKSPTTTAEDEKIARKLAEIAGVNLDEYGLAMLKAGTNLAAKSDEELISQDAKTFEMGGKKVRIDQVNTVDLADVFAREDGLKAAINAQMQSEGYDLFLLMVTNILDSNTRLLVLGEPTDVVETAFGKKLADNKMDLPGVVSRKKQVVPPLQDAFNA